MRMEGNPGLLPADVLLKIFSYCSYRDLVQFQFVCRWWQEVSRDKHLWRDIIYKPNRSETTKDVVDNLKASPELRALDLSDVECTTVTEELVIEIVNVCPRLEQLALCWDCLYEKFPFKMEKIKILICAHSKGMPDWDKVVYYFNQIENCYFDHLLNCFPNIEHLDMDENVSYMESFHAYLRKKGQSFHTLTSDCAQLPFEECILPYLSLCPNLKCLTLYGLCEASRDLFVESVEHLKQISSLTLRKSWWNDLYNNSSIFRFFPNLVELELDRCVPDSEQALLIIAKNCTLLEKLTLNSLGIWDENLKYVSNFKKLAFLGLKRNHQITDACVAHLQDISELRYLDISDCSGLTPQCLLDLCSFAKLQTLKFDLKNRKPPSDLDASHVKNKDLHIMFYNCKDTSVLDHLRHQRFKISLLKKLPYKRIPLRDFFHEETLYWPGQSRDEILCDSD